MKSTLTKLTIVLVVAAGVVFALHSQPTSQSAGKKTYDTYGSDGRYRLIVASETYGNREYVIDTQSGRVWHSTLDQQKGLAVFVADTYENINGDISTIPNENATELVFKPTSASAPQPSQPGTTQPFNFFDAAKQK